MRTGRLSIVIGACAASLVLAASASADTVQVTTNLDTLGGGDGCTLRDAVNSVELNSSQNACNLVTAVGTDKITFAGSLSGQTIELSNGALPIDATLGGADLEITGPGMNNLTISAADGERAFRLVNGVIDISGMTVRDGEQVGADQVRGGCILVDGTANVHLIDVRVTNCTATATGTTDQFADGAGIGVLGSLTLDGSVVDGNTATATNTGGDSTSSQARGGGIYADFGSFLRLEDSTIDSNTATATDDGSGEAIAAGGIYSIEELELDQSAVTENSAAATQTGAPGGNAITGGGIMVGDGTGDIQLSTIADNTGDPSTSGVTFQGGGILSQASDLQIRSSTIALNGPSVLTMLDGVNLFVRSGTTSVANSILADGRGGGLSCIALGTLTSGGFNVDYPPNPSGPPDSSCFDPMAATDLTANPLLAAGGLANNGGPTQTIALQPGSPAIDAGSNVGDVDETVDQRGLTRPVDFPGIPNAAGGNATDIGAFEVQASCAGQPTPGGTCPSGGGSTTPPPVTPTTPSGKKKCKKAKKGASSAKKKCKKKK